MHERAIFIHNKFLRHPDFPIWLARVFDKVREHKDELIRISKRIQDTTVEKRMANPIVRRSEPW